MRLGSSMALLLVSSCSYCYLLHRPQFISTELVDRLFDGGTRFLKAQLLAVLAPSSCVGAQSFDTGFAPQAAAVQQTPPDTCHTWNEHVWVSAHSLPYKSHFLFPSDAQRSKEVDPAICASHGQSRNGIASINDTRGRKIRNERSCLIGAKETRYDP